MAKKHSTTLTIPSAEFETREAPGKKREVLSLAVQTTGKLGSVDAVAQVETYKATKKEKVNGKETGRILTRTASRHAVRPVDDDPTLRGRVIGDKKAKSQLMDIVVGVSLYGDINSYLKALALTAQTADTPWVEAKQ